MVSFARFHCQCLSQAVRQVICHSVALFLSNKEVWRFYNQSHGDVEVSPLHQLRTTSTVVTNRQPVDEKQEQKQRTRGNFMSSLFSFRSGMIASQVHRPFPPPPPPTLSPSSPASSETAALSNEGQWLNTSCNFMCNIAPVSYTHLRAHET